jgi:hypothetical protein
MISTARMVIRIRLARTMFTDFKLSINYGIGERYQCGRRDVKLKFGIIGSALNNSVVIERECP